MAKGKTGLGGWLLFGVIVLGLGQCNRSDDLQSNTPAAAPQPIITHQTPPAAAVRQPATHPSETNASIPAPSPLDRFVSASSLNVRSAPNKEARVVGSLANGAQVRVFEMEGVWVRISEATEASRWVHDDYLSPERPTPHAAPQTAIVQPSSASVPRGQIVQEIINRSLRSYSGNCPCPYNRMSSGRRCEGNSAYSKPGGASPICYESDVTEAMIQSFRP